MFGATVTLMAYICTASGPGLEPRIEVSETPVLPLHYPELRKAALSHWFFQDLRMRCFV